MKKLRNLCIAIIALVGLSGSAFAQTNSGITPAIGTEHGYWVNANAAGAGFTTGYPTGNTYLWYVTKGDLTSPAPATDVTIGEFATGDPAYVDATTAVVDLYRIKLTWLAPSATSTYYLHIIETSADDCSNHKVEIINPFSDFQLAIANVAVADLTTAAADDLKVCAPDVALSLGGGGAVEYNYGTTALYYKVDATNIDTENYVLGYNIDVNDAFTGTVTATYSTDGGTNYSALVNYVDATDVTQSITNTANASSVIIRVELANGTTFEGITSHDVTVKLVSGAQGVALATIPTDLADKQKKQDVPARPSTSGIGSN
ncbi:hypothetical protein L3073_13010 [Ancylomarina sp. DW003]|nr:hypothetical protein [Ancylomarina sp. DW003]MDE5423132.1 hypothetical protein [Ancylomarina sp. DW003]